MLAGHSQGSRLISMVLAEYMLEHPDRYARMIAAYRVGDGLTREYLAANPHVGLTREYLAANPHVKAAEGPDDLGVCASWNTEGPANVNALSLVVPPDCVCINPLNWRIDEEPAGTELNLGCAIPNMADGSLVQLEGIANARVDLARGSVIVDSEACKPYTVTAMLGNEFEPVFGPESYHLCDYGFFYYNIRENAKLRAP